MKILDGPIVRREPVLAQQVGDYLRTQIENGELAAGDKLPSELQLAELLEVSRTVIREALALLKHDGLIESIKGGRTRVAKDPHGWVFRLEKDDLEDQKYLTHLYEMRFIVEPEAAALTALRATKKKLARIKQTLADLNRVRDSGDDATNESLAFHEALMDGTGNPHFSNFVAWLGKKFFSCIKHHVIERNAQYISIIKNEHEAIMESILSRDHKKAREHTRYHILASARRHGIELDLPDQPNDRS